MLESGPNLRTKINPDTPIGTFRGRHHSNRKLETGEVEKGMEESEDVEYVGPPGTQVIDIDTNGNPTRPSQKMEREFYF